MAKHVKGNRLYSPFLYIPFKKHSSLQSTPHFTSLNKWPLKQVLSLSNDGNLGQAVLLGGGGCPVYCTIFSRISGLFPVAPSP